MVEHNHKSNLPKIESDDFARRFSLRAKRLMWFLGAGASAAAGVPTAMDMVWEFKRELYVSQQKVSRQAVADLSNPIVRAKLQTHINGLQHIPEPGAADEYAALFEQVYPSETDRSSYIKTKIEAAKPSYGHVALATLMRSQFVRILWTTNFDRLLDDACATIYGTTASLTTVDLDSPHKAKQAIDDEQWPIQIKLHGDFQSRRLKNTADELRWQDTNLRKMLVDSCGRFGLVVVGYSGRDDSVMDEIDRAADIDGSFPSGLFWLHRGETPPLPRVYELLNKARANGIEAALVSIENFDETLQDLVRLFENVNTAELDNFAEERQCCSSAPLFADSSGWPVVRLNALRVTLVPTICRRVACEIGGNADVRDAIQRAGTDVIAARIRSGVLAFGADTEVRASFQTCGITEFDLHTLETKRQKYNSSERGLLREALTAAIVRERRLEVVRHRRLTDLLAPANPQNDTWGQLRQIVGTITGNVDNHQDLTWREGISIRLDWAHNHLWLLIEPHIVFDGMTDENKTIASDFARKRTVKRYNKELNALLEFWTRHLAGNQGPLRALGIADGIDAVFRLSLPTAFSWRAKK